MSDLQHCLCGCHTLIRGAPYVNEYHEYLHQQGETHKPYPASLPKPAPAPMAYPPVPDDQIRPYPSLTSSDLPSVSPTHRPWVVMWEIGWSVEKIADAWNETPETVSQVLNQLSVEPLPARRVGTGDLSTKERANAQRNRIRHLYRDQGWSLEQLRQAYPVYSRGMLEKIIKQSLIPAPVPKRCKRCETPITGKRSTKVFCSDRCRVACHRGTDESLAPVAGETVLQPA
jgi:hypothetical protein